VLLYSTNTICFLQQHKIGAEEADFYKDY
jgi:hypothetical protein